MYFYLSALLFFLCMRAASKSGPHPLDHSINTCHERAGIPFLETEMLDATSLEQLNETRFMSLAWMDTDTDTNTGQSGGTFGFVPAPVPISKNGRTRQWSAPEAENLSLANPNRMGMYFRNEVLNTNAYPWSTIGRVEFERFKGDSGGWCTASLVGKDLILTASHCFPWGFGEHRWMRFTPGYRFGKEPYGKSFVSRCRGVKNTLNVTGIDYIVCHLCKPLGMKAGWMGTLWWQEADKYMAPTWQSSGYPADSFGGLAQMLRSGIRLEKIDNHFDKGNELESDLYASAGWSGGPMWGYIAGAPTIVGVCSGSERDCSERVGGCNRLEDFLDNRSHDVSAGGRLMSDLVLYGVTHWDEV
jgi:V8-like Glu-specific endopeptidase